MNETTPKIEDQGEPIPIVIKTHKTKELNKTDSSDKSDASKHSEKVVEIEKLENRSYVKNSSFLSKDIEARSKDDVKVNTQTLKKNKQSSPPKKDANNVTSPPISTFKLTKTDSKEEKCFSPPKVDKLANHFSPPKTILKQNSISKEKIEAPLSELQMKLEKVAEKIDDNQYTNEKKIESVNPPKVNDKEVKTIEVKAGITEDSNGVGDKIKKFEKAAEELAPVTPGRLSRANSLRGRGILDRLSSEEKDDLSAPLPLPPQERQRQPTANNATSNLPGAKWTKTEFDTQKVKKEPQKVSIIKPEFKPIQSPGEVTIRSPSLGVKLPEQFSSHGTAFRNVAGNDAYKFNDDVNNPNSKPCKFKKEKISISKGSSYFTRGSEDMWLVKKKDIEAIEERVLDSFMRAGGKSCARNDVRPSSDSGNFASMSHTMGRNKRPAYARSESLDPQAAGARAQTLKRQSSVACTCGHDKNKTRSKSSCDAANRPRTRSHGDDNAQVLEKYETLV